MEAGTKETLCSKCLHLWVCKYKEELLETTSKVCTILFAASIIPCSDVSTSSSGTIFDSSRFHYELKCPEYIENGTIGLR